MKLNLLKGTLLLTVACMLFTQSSYAISFSNPSSDGNQGTVTEDSSVLAEKAISEFKSLSKHDRKERMAEVKKELKQYKKDKRAGKGDASTNTLLLVILAILLPPLAVYLHEGEINSKFWIDLILTLIFFIPGVIYALIVIL